jgi:hypothetical protein
MKLNPALGHATHASKKQTPQTRCHLAEPRASPSPPSEELRLVKPLIQAVTEAHAADRYLVSVC